MRKRNEKNLTLYYFLSVAVMLIGLIVGITVFRFYMLGFRNDDDAEIYEQYYVMITDDPTSSMWQSVYQGALLEGEEDKIYVDLLGENLNVKYSCIELMDIAVNSGVDGIIVYADESDDMLESINHAVEMGIPVVTLLNDCTLSDRCSYVGIGGYNLVREYGKEVLNILSGMEFDEADPVEIVVLADSEREDTQTSIIVSGLQGVLTENYGDNAYINISFARVDNTNAFSAEESIRDIFTASDVPDILLCLNELNTTCAYQAVVDYNMVGRVNILGYYDSDTILQAVDRHVINATASIDTYQMGQYCVDALKEYNELGYTSQYYTASVTIIDSDNISKYYKGGNDDE